ncbi:uncharacterized protein AMSG_00507 [Thecamonas trahens ATCC 50062]|uniref:Uncharacterized protein n=1 Tax=Thecamonas trahens ATCC 50062 TaxID=461836 RepID=A0A0L0D8M4_THETB|nr:hypothetical protein AMSG_00507 [Thecamonas trahens ATCC 50062]KNC48732.1 hypothetical protein AMSG_00507 [Thecamonas trahens ATCC 50062]|eukprot:XP_013762784.1 hypothetical protein AMSG_00507 [Thecamonas trahens ATCC 50062]
MASQASSAEAGSKSNDQALPAHTVLPYSPASPVAVHAFAVGSVEAAHALADALALLEPSETPLALALAVDPESGAEFAGARSFVSVSDGVLDPHLIAGVPPEMELDAPLSLLHRLSPTSKPASDSDGDGDEAAAASAPLRVPAAVRGTGAVPAAWWKSTQEALDACNRAAAGAADAYQPDVVRDDEVEALQGAESLVGAAAAAGSDLWLVDRPEWITLQRYYTAHKAVSRAQRAARYQFTYQLSQERLAAAARSGNYDDDATKDELEAKLKAGTARVPTRLRSFVLDVATHKHNVWTSERAKFTAAAVQRLLALESLRDGGSTASAGDLPTGAADADANCAPTPWVALVVPDHMLPYIVSEWRGSHIDELAFAKLLMTEEGVRTPAFTREALARRRLRQASSSSVLATFAKISAVGLAAAVAAIDALANGII